MNSSADPWSPSRVSGGDHGGTDVVVSFEQVSKRYKGAPINALNDIDLSVRGGEFFSLLGPSGSGKTTCLRLIAGFEQPDSGVISLDGTSMVGVPAYQRDINTVFQNYALFPHMTVAENVAYPLKMRRVPKAQIAPRVAEALDLVSMVGFEERLPQQLSGGQRQRVALARALIVGPASYSLMSRSGRSIFSFASRCRRCSSSSREKWESRSSTSPMIKEKPSRCPTV